MERSTSIVKTNAKRKRNLEHNNRQYKNEKHIDKFLQTDNVLYAYDYQEKKIRAYHATDNNYKSVANSEYEKNVIDDIFSEDVADYNAEQKGNRRRILDGAYNDFESKTKSRGGLNLEREIIITVGSKDDYKGMSDSDVRKEIELRKKVNRLVVDGFSERYPNLVPTQAHIHNDERDENASNHLKYVNPHIHLAYIPKPEKEYAKSGKVKRPSASMNKALLNMFPNAENDSSKAFNDFTDDLRDWVDELVLLEDPTHRRKVVGTKEHRSVNDFKEVQDELAKVAALQNELQASIARANAVETQNKRAREVLEEKTAQAEEQRLKALDVEKTMKKWGDRMAELVQGMPLTAQMKDGVFRYITSGNTGYIYNAGTVKERPVEISDISRKIDSEMVGKSAKKVDVKKREEEDLEL